VGYLDDPLKHDAGDVSSVGYDNFGYPGYWQIVGCLSCLTQSGDVAVGSRE
jgi:hypothetical protein